MQRSSNPNLHQSNGMRPNAEQVEEVLRFARKLEMHSDHEQLLRALPAELCALERALARTRAIMNTKELEFFM